MTEQTKAVGWARVFAAVRPEHSKILRRGAWYPVVRDELPDRVSIGLGPRQVEVPRRFIELRRDRPKHFSVVYRIGYEPEPDRKSQHNLGKRYAVCPNCGSRAALWGRPVTVQCKVCGHNGEVGWWE